MIGYHQEDNEQALFVSSSSTEFLEGPSQGNLSLVWIIVARLINKKWGRSGDTSAGQ